MDSSEAHLGFFRETPVYCLVADARRESRELLSACLFSRLFSCHCFRWLNLLLSLSLHLRPPHTALLLIVTERVSARYSSWYVLLICVCVSFAFERVCFSTFHHRRGEPVRRFRVGDRVIDVCARPRYTTRLLSVSNPCGGSTVVDARVDADVLAGIESTIMRPRDRCIQHSLVPLWPTVLFFSFLLTVSGSIESQNEYSVASLLSTVIYSP